MKTTDYLDAIKSRYGLASDYALARFWGCAKQNIYRFRKNGDTFNDATALKVAEWLEIDPAQVIADMHAERAEKAGNPALVKAWQRIARSVAASVLLAFSVALIATPSPASAAGVMGQCILC